jgi:hypothetical protein
MGVSGNSSGVSTMIWIEENESGWMQWLVFLFYATAVLHPTHASGHSPPKAMQKRDSMFLWCERAIMHSVLELPAGYYYQVYRVTRSPDPTYVFSSLGHTNSIFL